MLTLEATNGVTVTLVVAVEVQKLEPIDVTVYEPADETVIEGPNAPVLQAYNVPPLAVKTTLLPEHKFVEPEAVITGVGKALIETLVAALVAIQPLTSVTVTEYEPASEAVYEEPAPTIDEPFLQEYVEPALAVKTTLPPEQKVVAPPAVIDAVGNGLTVMVIVVVVAQSPAVGVNV